jgi:hypothetical protein
MIVPVIGEVTDGPPVGTAVSTIVVAFVTPNARLAVWFTLEPKVMLATPLLGNANVAAAVVAPMQARHFIPVLKRDHSPA